MKRKTYTTVRQRIFRYLSINTFIPFFMLSFLLFGYILYTETTDQQQTFHLNLSEIQGQMTNAFSSMSQLAKSISQDDSLKDYLSEKMNTEIIQEKELEGNGFLLTKYYFAGIYVYIIGENGIRLKSNYLSFKNEDFRNTEWYLSLAQSRESQWFGIHQNSFVSNDLPGGYAAYGIPLFDTESGSFIGAVLAEISVSPFFSDLCAKSDARAYVIRPGKTILTENDHLELHYGFGISGYDGFFTSYSYTDSFPGYIDQTIRHVPYQDYNHLSSGFFRTFSHYVGYGVIEESFWVLVVVLDNMAMMRRLLYTLLLLMLITLILVALSLAISARLAANFSEPVERLKDNILEIRQGNFNTQIQDLPGDEIGEFGYQLSRMNQAIRDLLAQTKEEQEQLRRYELMLLQVQINPHFLYNTLDSLQWLIRMEQKKDALEITSAMISFFKTGLNHGNDVIRLEEDMEHSRSYLIIQQFRYKSKLSFALSSQEELSSFLMPRIILQPFIENAIYHGIKKKENGGKVTVDAYRMNNAVFFVIEDNGVGMPHAVLAKLRKSLQSEEQGLSDHYGILNVHNRLRLYFKDRYSLDIESVESKGTTVTIRIEEG